MPSPTAVFPFFHCNVNPIGFPLADKTLRSFVFVYVNPIGFPYADKVCPQALSNHGCPSPAGAGLSTGRCFCIWHRLSGDAGLLFGLAASRHASGLKPAKKQQNQPGGALPLRAAQAFPHSTPIFSRHAISSCLFPPFMPFQSRSARVILQSFFPSACLTISSLTPSRSSE